jgi:hypothetical protein
MLGINVLPINSREIPVREEAGRSRQLPLKVPLHDTPPQL